MATIKKREIPLVVQAYKLQHYFPDSKWIIDTCGNRLVWKGVLQPTNLGQRYQIKMTYNRGKHPDVYVIDPNPLVLPNGAEKLEHVYDTKKQHLCIYYRMAKEWDANKLIADTIIPWTSEWLMHYEYWVATGTWHGRGIEH